LKILIVTPYLQFPGGVEKMNSYLRDIFVGLGHDVDFLTTEEQEALKTPKWKVKLFGRPAMTAHAYDKRVKDFDLVICNGEYGWGIHWKKSILIYHGSFKGVRDGLKGDLSFWSYLSLTWQSILQSISSKNKYVVTVSEYCKDVLSKQGVKVNSVIQNFVDLESFKQKINNEKRSGYLFVGKYHYKGKGIDVVEELAKNLDTSITCVTDREVKKPLKWIKSSPQLSLTDVYNQHRILILPSRFESSGLVALEAMACGVPVVMNRVGCALELEKEIPEFVCKKNTASEYQKKISEIEKNYEYFSSKAREYVHTHHSKKVFKESWGKVLERVC